MRRDEFLSYLELIPPYLFFITQDLKAGQVERITYICFQMNGKYIRFLYDLLSQGYFCYRFGFLKHLPRNGGNERYKYLITHDCRRV